MNHRPDEHGELVPTADVRFAVDRRGLLALAGAGVAILMTRRGEAAGRSGDDLPDDLAAWLHVGEDGRVVAYCGKVELGQNVTTSLTQAIAEELPVSPAAIEVILADTALVPYDAGTFGSRSTPTVFPRLRRAAAAAREAIIALAAERWGVPAGEVALADGRVRHAATGREAGLGDLTGGRRFERVIGEPSMKPAADWTVCGTSLPKVGAAELVTGRAKFPSDLTQPDMLIGKVLRPPAQGARLAALDDFAAAAMPGVAVVRDGDFVGVTAPDAWTASKALAALRPTWEGGGGPSRGELFDLLRREAEPGRPEVEGDPAAGRAAATTVLEETFLIDYIAHVPMEPRVALAAWDGDALTVWCGTSRPFGVRDELQRGFSLTGDRVRVIAGRCGNSFGGKHTGDAALEAARLARAAGRPVRVMWTREEEFRWAYLRPAGVIDVRAGLGPDGRLTWWEHDNINSGGAGLRTPYAVPHSSHVSRGSRSPFRQGSYRSLAATANFFARESAMSALAGLIGADPLEFRLRNLTEPRLRAVFEAAAARFGWPQRPGGHGIGLAGGTEKGSFQATCVEVALEPDGSPRIVRVVVAFECGAVINPRQVVAQIEGQQIMGLGGALFERIEFEHGWITNANLTDYRLPRFADLPAIESVLVNRPDLTSVGAGETPMLGLAPAVGHAVWQLTGRRPTTLPMRE